MPARSTVRREVPDLAMRPSGTARIATRDPGSRNRDQEIAGAGIAIRDSPLSGEDSPLKNTSMPGLSPHMSRRLRMGRAAGHAQTHL